MRMPELKALMKERGLRGYSQLRKDELIAFLKNNENRAQRRQRPPQMSTLGTKSTSTDVFYLGTRM